MSEVWFIREPSKANIPYLIKRDCLIVSDSPDARNELRELGVSAIGSSALVNNTHWLKIINQRDLIIHSMDINSILLSLNLDLELESSLKFHLKFLVSELLYEAFLVASVIERYSCNKVFFDENFQINKITKFETNERSTFIKIKKAFHCGILNKVNFCITNTLFVLSLLWIRLFHKNSLLATSPGSGLKSVLEKQSSVVFLYGNGASKDIKNKVLKCFSLKNSEMMAFPAPRSTIKATKNFEIEVNKGASRLTEGVLKLVPEHLGSLSVSSLSEWLSFQIKDWGSKRKRDMSAIQSVISCMGPKAVVSQHSLDFAACLGIITKNQKINSFLISHGSHIVNADSVADREWLGHSRTMLDGPFKYTAIQTPAAKAFYEKNCFQTAAYETGPLIVKGKLSKSNSIKRKALFGLNSDMNIILHAGTPKPPNALRPIIYETTDEYLDNICSFVREASKVPNTFVAIRFRPCWGISLKSIENALIGYTCWGVFCDGSFEDFLEQSDALVSYSSTTIEQALFAGKPVILWSDQVDYKHLFLGSFSEKLNALKGVWISDSSSLARDIEEINSCFSTSNVNYSDTVQSLYHSFEALNYNQGSALLKLGMGDRV
ncbi:hypothetical protein TW85_03425 [Marinomonas sp. S3726]|uniref:hypothetical protein n=1 Tax=Marinomonas sp. S3726 TaxID=579484 RepID=UPI0005FA7CB8|nr:hypothetical protein [Marinomonas sp. S3726]KJZ15947.1 hypothetical protein TW85_03425 [Marinomonas sp. S3726]